MVDLVSFRVINVNLRIVKEPTSMHIRLDDIFKTDSEFNLACQIDDGGIFNLNGSILQKVNYRIDRASHIATPSNPLTEAEMYNANGDGVKQVQIGLNQLDGTAVTGNKASTLNTQFEDIIITSIEVISPKHGFIKMYPGQLFDISAGSPQVVICYPEIEYVYCSGLNMHHSTIGTAFDDFGILENGADLHNDHTYIVQTFGYDANHSGDMRVFSVVLKDSTSQECITCNFKSIMIAGQPIVPTRPIIIQK